MAVGLAQLSPSLRVNRSRLPKHLQETLRFRASDFPTKGQYLLRNKRS